MSVEESKETKFSLRGNNSSSQDFDFGRKKNSRQRSQYSDDEPSYRHREIMETRNMRSVMTSKVVEVLKLSVKANTASSRHKSAAESSNLFFRSDTMAQNLTEDTALVTGVEELSLEDSLNMVLQPKEDEKSSFLDTRYCHQLTVKNKETATGMVHNVEYYKQLKAMNWAVRVFVNQIEVEDAHDEFTPGFVKISDNTKWVLAEKKREYVCGSESVKSPTLQQEVIHAMNNDFAREECPVGRLSSSPTHQYVKAVSFHRVSSTKPPKIRRYQPFSAASLCHYTQRVSIKVEMEEGIEPKSITFEAKIAPTRGTMRITHKANAVVNVFDGIEMRRKKLCLIYGFDCISKNDHFADEIEKWTEVNESIQKQENLIRQYPPLCRNLYQARKQMSCFLSQLKPKNIRAGLGAIGVDLLKGIEIEDMDFEKNYADGVKRLRYITFKEENRAAIRKIFEIMSLSKSMNERLQDVRNEGLDNPYAMSEPVAEDESVDFFISHSWSDKASTKFEALSKLSNDFLAENGRLPKLWIDGFCIDQNIETVQTCVGLLPLFLMACEKMVVLMSNSLVTRLWCLGEILTRHLLGNIETDVTDDIILLPVEDCRDLDVNVSDARCFNKEDEEQLRNNMEHIPGLEMCLVEEIILKVLKREY